MTVIFHNWKYERNSNEEGFSFRITPDREINIPNTLFKYYALTENSVSSLEDQKFYISQPHDFNDLFDSSHFRLDFGTVSKSEIRKMLSFLSDSVFEKMWQADERDTRSYGQHSFMRTATSLSGLLCLTPNSLNDLMWGYYGNNGGFCLELDHSKFDKNFKGPYPINYIDEFTPLIFENFGGHYSYIILTTTKKKMWSHEDEVRFIVEPKSGHYKTKGLLDNSLFEGGEERFEKYHKTSLISITLGFKFVKNEAFEAISDTEYIIEFTSNEATLKQRLFDHIICNDIKCHCIIQQLPLFVLEKKPWKIEKLENSKYRILQLE